MTFSLRLTADLTLARVARVFGADWSPILQVSSDKNFAAPSASRLSKEGSAENALAAETQSASLSRSPIIWISGSEPLDHPDAAQFANAVAAAGRHVFVETSGTSLKRRLHEFKPSSRFHFVVRFEGQPTAESDPKSAEVAFRTGIESLRMARLAGFFTCAHLVLNRVSSYGEIEKLYNEIHKLDVDGFLITAAVKSPALEKLAVDSRRRLLPSRWARLSRLLDSSARTPEASRSPRKVDHVAVPEQQQEDSFAESAEAQ